MLALLLIAALAPSPLKQVAPGVETAAAADLGGNPGWAARVVLVDPARATFLVRYDPSRPTLPEWRQKFPRALAIVNGSFYSLDGPAAAPVRPTCDLVLEGKPVRGAGCHRQDALFFGAKPRQAVPASLPSSQARLLTPANFRPEQWQEALKSFPALVREGAAACAGAHYCAESSRTAALAQLKDGRIVLFASQWPAVRREVGKWLAEGLGAVEALNLDGGPEASLAVKTETSDVATPGVGLPMVLVVLPP
ncbi:MAG: phosphodiester glycosidase family protein [Deltaproteobacteria bacterium]|nr:MAG: phosphodiester glycosidase family protein [Deltaproteobacteria bacterium]